jgi:hypothetical protein
LSIYRAPHPDRDFAVIDKHCTRDTRLKASDLGILIRLLALPPWGSTNVQELVKGGADGYHVVTESLKRLAAHGYVRRVRNRRENGTWETVTFVFDTPGGADAAVAEWDRARAAVKGGGTDPIPGLSVPAGQSQSPKSPVDNAPVLKEDVPAGQNHWPISVPAEPAWLSRAGSPAGYVSTSHRTPSMDAREPDPIDALADGFMDGFPEQANRPDRAGVVKACRELPPGWTPAALARWASAQNWSGAGGGAVVARLRAAGAPPPPPKGPERGRCSTHPEFPPSSCPRCETQATPPPLGFRAQRARARGTAPKPAGRALRPAPTETRPAHGDTRPEQETA